MKIKVGDKFLINRQTPTGATMPELATVIEIGRNMLRLKTDGGDIITMLR